MLTSCIESSNEIKLKVMGTRDKEANQRRQTRVPLMQTPETKAVLSTSPPLASRHQKERSDTKRPKRITPIAPPLAPHPPPHQTKQHGLGRATPPWG